MRRLARSCVLAAVLLASGAALAQAPVAAPPAAPAASAVLGPHNPSAPIDISADGVDIFQPQRLIVYKGNVEAISDDTRLRTPELRVYYKPKTAAAPGAKPAPAPASGAPISESDSIDHIEAAGPVYYITPTENARGDHGTYVADTTTYTLTGNVVVVQGKSVGKGDRLVMNRTTGESNLYADHPQAPNQRVRMILYPNQQPAAGAKPAPKSS
jgi:lipopolysaccharide export system protein LptA